MTIVESIVHPFLGCRLKDAAILLLVFYIGFCLAILAHEIAHYLAARAFGIISSAVHVGHFGPELAFNHAGTRFILRLLANPLGSGHTDFEQLTASYFGVTVILFAGIAINIIMGLALLFIGIRLQNAPLLVLALASFSMGVGQLAPVRGTDGWMLLQIALGRIGQT